VDAVTGTVTGNTFVGFLDEDHVVFNNNDFAGMRIGENRIVP
jgi:hypothetical protein